jgi:hypothetical protein
MRTQAITMVYWSSLAPTRWPGTIRSGLLTAYDGYCAISDSVTEQVLEAAHVTPYLGPLTNDISNGLLSRSDLHRLWDRGLIYLCDELKVKGKSALNHSECFGLGGKKIRSRATNAPPLSMDEVREHREWCLKFDSVQQ